MSRAYTYCAPPPFLLGGLNFRRNFQKGGGLVGPQLLERVAGKEGMTFFTGAMQFSGCLKREGTWPVCRFRVGGVFEMVDASMHTILQ